MNFRKVPVAVMAGALLSCAGWNVGSAQPAKPLPGDVPATVGRVYSIHTAAVGGCPSLDWHIVVGELNKLSGMIGTDDMKVVFSVTGQYNPADKTFKLSGKEIGGSRNGAVNGQVQTDGRMAASLGGLPVGSACQGKTVYVQWQTAYDPYGAAGGGGG